MNIFFVDENPKLAAECLVDKHVVKMILETAQLLSTSHRLLDGNKKIVTGPSGRKISRYVLADHREAILPQATHINHPCAVWTRANRENYHWLWQHLLALNDEYTRRFNRRHAYSGRVLFALHRFPLALSEGEFFNPPTAMSQEYIVWGDAVASYRNYYRLGKSHLHSYTNRNTPEWLLS